ncbi:hypothetical protein DRN52_01690 [Thermococci archaeon]|nr:MAG: hypothetical protein DRN52_01690 [Thermococci archaeon]
MVARIYIPLIFLVLALPTATAITVTPSSYSTTQKDTFDTIHFNISNPENQTVNVTITIDSQLQGKIVFNETSFSIPPNSTYEVTAFLSRMVPTSGYVHFNNVDVRIEVKAEANLTTIPETPSAGKGMVILLQGQNATGYLFVYATNNVYPVEVKRGIGFLQLSEEDYGNAILIVYGRKTYSKTINIKPPEIGSLYIVCPSLIKVNENATFIVYADGEPVRARLVFSGADNFALKTNKNGVAKLRFKKPGNYTIKAEYFSYTCEQTFKVIPRTIDIQIPSSVKTGVTMQIKAKPNAVITIKKGDTTWSYTANADGVAFFTPPSAGKYEITAKTEDAEGYATFTAKTDTSITVMSSEGVQINKVKEGDVIMLHVISSDNSPASGNIEIFTDGIFYKSLIVEGGVTLWKVDKQANTYEFRFNPSDESYFPCSIAIKGEKTINYMFISIFVAVGLVAGGIYYAYSKGWLKLKLPSREKYKDLI